MAAPSISGLCETCRASLPVCLACGQPVTGKSLEFDGTGPYCLDCYRTRPPCDICGAPLTDERWQLSDGRMTCQHCHASAVFTLDVAGVLYEQMKEVVFNQLGFELNIPTGLALVDRNQLKEVIRLQTDGKQAASWTPGFRPGADLGQSTRAAGCGAVSISRQVCRVCSFCR